MRSTVDGQSAYAPKRCPSSWGTQLSDHPGVPEDFHSYLDRIDDAYRTLAAYIEEQLRDGAAIATDKLLQLDEQLKDREQDLLHYTANRRHQ